MNKALLTLLALLAGRGLAFTVSGTVGGSVPTQSRVGGFLVDGSGTPLQEIASVPISGGRFSLSLPDGTPAARAFYPLRPDLIVWPGVLEPVTVSAPANVADLRLYVYVDRNGNGRRDPAEPLLEAPPQVGRALVQLSYASTGVRVSAARGYDVTLVPGWNGLLVEVGRSLRVTALRELRNVTLYVER